MQRRGSLGLSMLVLLALGSACGDDDGAAQGGPDGGTAGNGPATGMNEDAGPLVWTPRDSGQSLPPIDVPPPSGGSGGVDAMCAMTRDPLPAAFLPRCAASTRECIDACADAADTDACRSACIASDTTPPESMYGLACDSCIYLQLFACIDAAGCHDGVAAVFCCLADKCPEGSPEGCSERECGAELMAAFTCGYYAKMECLELTAELAGQCFAPGDDADGGT